MKALNVITTLAAAAAVYISAYAILTRPRLETATGADPKTLVVEFLKRPRWDGTDDFFKQRRAEMTANVEVANVLETDGVGIAFIRTSGGGRKFQFCVWMRKTALGWEQVQFLSPDLSENPFLAKWIEKNKDWLREMDSKKHEWEKQSQSAW